MQQVNDLVEKRKEIRFESFVFVAYMKLPAQLLIHTL